jgi:hypothetical protein
MTCDHARAMFSELADQAVPDAERAACEAHLAACPDCRREWETLQRMLALLRGMPRLRAPAGFAARVLGAVPPTPWHRRLLRGLFVPLPVKLPLEAAALVLVAVGAVYLVQRTPELQQAARQDTPPPGEAKAPPPGREPAKARPLARQAAPEGRAPSPIRKEAPAMARDRTIEAPRSAPSVPEMADKPAEAPKMAPPRVIESPPPEVAAPRVLESPGRAPSRVVTPSLEARREAQQPIAGAAPPAGAGPPAFIAPPAGAGALAPPTVSGRLVVEDRDAAEAALGELAARVGATEVGRWRTGEATIVELQLSDSAYPEFARALGRLGAWAADHEPAALPARVRVVLRITR